MTLVTEQVKLKLNLPYYTMCEFPAWFSFADVLKDTVNSLTLLLVKLRQTQLWSEFAIIKRIIYKHGNQHRKQFYFHGLRRVWGFKSITTISGFKNKKELLVVSISVTKPVRLHKQHPKTTNMTTKSLALTCTSKLLIACCFSLNNNTCNYIITFFMSERGFKTKCLKNVHNFWLQFRSNC